MDLGKRKALSILFFLGFGLLLSLAVGGLDRLMSESRDARVDAADASLPMVEEEPEGPVDLDATVRAMLDLDAFVADAQSLDDYLLRSKRLDWRSVAPDVRRARVAILAQLEELSALEAKAQVHEQSWNWQRSLLSAARVLNLGGKASFTDVSLEAGLDTSQAAQVSGEYAKHILRGGQFDLQALLGEARLKGLIQSYGEAAYVHVQAWDALCAERDQAMLAALNGHFQRAVVHAERAIALSPAETEAHLILAMALIEWGRSKLPQRPELVPGVREGLQPEAVADDGRAELARAAGLLEEFVMLHPDRAAPARLLQGVLAGLKGDAGLAKDRLDFSAAHFPKQATELTRNLGPLRVRSKYLSRSRAGLRILRAQSAMVEGAGYFSPDLQQAKLFFAQGDFERGRSSLLDHFARRRAQQNWEFVLSDLQFAYRAFGTDFRSIFPADSFLALVPAETWFGMGEDMNIEVINRLDHSLHNATLVLCARFTDMLPDDFATLGFDTLDEVPAGETVAFGAYKPAFRVHGDWAQGKMIQDSLRAILVSDEAVVWVDTLAYREKEHADVVRDLAKGLPRPELAIPWLKAEPEVLAAEVFEGSEMTIGRNAVIKDVLRFKLPAKVAVVRPLFRLVQGDELGLRPDDYRIEAGSILLEFRKDLEEPEDLPERWTLRMFSPFVEYDLIFTRRDEDSYGLDRVELRASLWLEKPWQIGEGECVKGLVRHKSHGRCTCARLSGFSVCWQCWAWLRFRLRPLIPLISTKRTTRPSTRTRISTSMNSEGSCLCVFTMPSAGFPSPGPR